MSGTTIPVPIATFTKQVANQVNALNQTAAETGRLGLVMPGSSMTVAIDGEINTIFGTITGTVADGGALTDEATTRASADRSNANAAASAQQAAAAAQATANAAIPQAALGEAAFTSAGGNTSRTLAARGADSINVLDYSYSASGDQGANVTALNAAITKATSDQASGVRIEVPGGVDWSINANPSYTGNNIWELNGANYYGSTTIVNSTGPDMYKTVYQGGEFWGRSQSNPTATPVLRIDDVKTLDIGAGNTMSTLKINATAANSISESYFYPLLVELTGEAAGGQHPATSSVVTRSASGSPSAAYWSYYGSAVDTPGVPSSTSGGMVGYEQDIRGSLADDGGAGSGLAPSGVGIRVGLDIIGATDTPTNAGNEIGFIIRAGGALPETGSAAWNPNIYAKRVYTAWGVYSVACFDTTMATPLSGSDASAFVMSAGQTFGLDGVAATTQAAPVHDFTWNASASEFQLRKNKTSFFSVSDVGAVSIASLLATGAIEGAALTVTGEASALRYTAAPGASTSAFSVTGADGAHGFDTSAATLSGMALRMAGTQKIAWEATDTITTSLDSSNNWNLASGSTVNFSVSQAGNISYAGARVPSTTGASAAGTAFASATQLGVAEYVYVYGGTGGIILADVTNSITNIVNASGATITVYMPGGGVAGTLDTGTVGRWWLTGSNSSLPA